MARRHDNAVCRLIVFTRYPVVGQCKTRLIPSIGAESACRLQRLLTEHVVAEARTIESAGEARVEICYDGGAPALMRQWLGEDLLYRPQVAGDLGTRMREPLEAALSQGARAAVLVGCDIPDMDASRMRGAIELLGRAPLVLTPTDDGGFCLIGTAGALPSMDGIDWGSSRVLDQMLPAIEAVGAPCELTGPLADLDTPQDLARLRNTLVRRLGPEAMAGLS